MNAKEYLKNKLLEDSKLYFGSNNNIDMIVDAWMNDKSNSRHRFDTINYYLPKAKKSLIWRLDVVRQFFTDC